jgi:5-enolpyruvylshikimate-3-phosphate synthase
MRKTREKISKAADAMLATATACLRLSDEETQSSIKLHNSASHQRKDADRLSDCAKKLARLGQKLEADALDLKASLDALTADKSIVVDELVA